MPAYKYLRNVGTFEPLDYSYAAYGGEDFLDEFGLARARALASVASYLQSHAERVYQEDDQAKRAEFIVFDSIFNASFYTSIPIDTERLKGWIREAEGSAAERLLKIYLLYLRKSAGISDAVQEEPFFEVFIGSEGVFSTGETLKLILIEGIDASLVHVIDAAGVLRELTRKFEIFQRIFVSYDASYRKTAAGFQSFTDYALLSIAAATVFERSANYRYLNALVKINDLLSGEGLVLSSMNEALFLKAALDKEAAIIKRLRKKR